MFGGLPIRALFFNGRVECTGVRRWSYRFDRRKKLPGVGWMECTRQCLPASRALFHPRMPRSTLRNEIANAFFFLPTPLHSNATYPPCFPNSSALVHCCSVSEIDVQENGRRGISFSAPLGPLRVITDYRTRLLFIRGHLLVSATSLFVIHTVPSAPSKRISYKFIRKYFR